MAYDRYGSRGGSREDNWRWSDDRSDMRERARGGRDERGFFERAGDEISSWFGDDDAERRRDRDEMRGDRSRQSRFGRDDDRFSRDHRSQDREPWGGGDREPRRDYGRDRGFERSQDRGDYRPITGDYSRSEGMFAASGADRSARDWNRDRALGGRSEWDRDDYRRTRFAGSSERSQHDDPHYNSWRQRQMDSLDRDYDDYRREHQSKFESDFGNWREQRQTKRQMLRQLRENMQVVGSDNEPVGTVDRIAGDRLILAKSDPEAGGTHHSLTCSELDRIEGDRAILGVTAEQAKKRWRDEGRERALFEREDQGEMGQRMLDRSFSGTYR